jgi:hypothetical protein
MPEITPSFVFEYERNMRAITETEYARRLAAPDVWWNRVVRSLPIEGKTERITWILNTATIEPVGPTGVGRIGFEDLVTQTAEYPVFRHGRGLRIQRDQLEDLDGKGLDFAAEWSMQIGNETAYYPQRLSSQLILNGANTDGSANAYDGIPFFADQSNPHPNNPFNLPAGYYANWLHGSGTSTLTPGYPGACPIDETNASSVEQAFINLQKVITYVKSLKMPNGIDPRFLRPIFLLVPPALTKRIAQITDAKFIAQAGTGGGTGSGDVEAVHEFWGLGQPIIVQEFAASTSYSMSMPFINATTGNTTFLKETATGSDTTYYVVCQEMQTTRLGGLLYVQRKPFKVNYYTGDSGGTAMSVELDRMNEFEYHVQGRMSVQYGHPYTIFRVDAT